MLLTGISDELKCLTEAIGIADLECTSIRIDISWDEIVTVTPTLILDSRAVPALQGMIALAKAAGRLVVKPTKLTSPSPPDPEIACDLCGWKGLRKELSGRGCPRCEFSHGLGAFL